MLSAAASSSTASSLSGSISNSASPPHSPPVPPPQNSTWLGLDESRRVVAKLSALFALDAFGGGFVIDSIVALWFNLKFGLSPSTIGTIFFFSNLFGGFSGLLAA